MIYINIKYHESMSRLKAFAVLNKQLAIALFNNYNES